jgi:hypothetical protein
MIKMMTTLFLEYMRLKGERIASSPSLQAATSTLITKQSTKTEPKFIFGVEMRAEAGI